MAKVNKDLIISNGKLRGAKEATTVIVTEGGNFNALDSYMNAAMRKLATTGQSLKAFKTAYAAHKAAVDAKTAPRTEAASLATGLDSRNAPHSSKSVGDARRATGTPAKKAEAAKPAAKKAAEPKGDKAPAAADTRKLVMVAKAENPHREDSNRAKAFEAARKAKTVADYSAAGSFAKPKYIAVWEKAGLIKVG